MFVLRYNKNTFISLCSNGEDQVHNAKVTSLTGLGPVLETIVRRRNSFFGHVAQWSNHGEGEGAVGRVPITLLELADVPVFSQLDVAAQESVNSTGSKSSF